MQTQKVVSSLFFPQNESQQSAVRGEQRAVPTRCLINSNLIRPVKGSSLDLVSKGKCTPQKYKRKKIQVVSVLHKRKLQVPPIILACSVQRAAAPLWTSGEIQGRQKKSASVLREGEWINQRLAEKKSLWKAANVCLPVCGQCEGVMTGFCHAGRGQDAGQTLRLEQQHDVIKESQHYSSTSDTRGAQEFLRNSLAWRT